MDTATTSLLSISVLAENTFYVFGLQVRFKY